MLERGMETAHVSLRGDREQNQDRCAVVRAGDCALLLLADGMGGHPKGEVAAQILIDEGRTAFAAASKPIKDPLGFLDGILRGAHEAIRRFGARHEPPLDPRATAVAALVQGRRAYWSHAGDSRLYLIRNARVVQRTRDHSFVEQMRSRGLLDGDPGPEKRLRNLVTVCLGGTGSGFTTARSLPTALVPGDLLLLCSDGLWNQLPEDRLLSLLADPERLDEVAAELARNAELAAAPASDNVTLVLLRWLGEAGGPTARSGGDEGEGTAPATDSVEPAGDPLEEAISYLRAVIDDFESKK
jgi:serine/threonine protein phosphatase PrpC